MEFKEQIIRIFKLHPDTPYGALPGKPIGINDSFSSLIYVLRDNIQNELEMENRNEESINLSIEKYLEDAKEKIRFFYEEIPKGKIDTYYSELISFANRIISDIDEYLNDKPEKLSKIIFKIPIKNLYEIVKNQFMKFRVYLIALKSGEINSGDIYIHFKRIDGVIHWDSTIPILVMILKELLNSEKIIFNKNTDYRKYFLKNPPLIKINKGYKYLDKCFKNYNINTMNDADKELIPQYLPLFIEQNKKRKINSLDI